MRGRPTPALEVTPQQRAILEHLERSPNSPQWLVLRIRIILKSLDGFNNQQVAQQLGINRSTVGEWRKRWFKAFDWLQTAQEHNDEDTEMDSKAREGALKGLVLRILRDEPRAGAPSKFTAEQICEIVSLACEDPCSTNRPVSHWTAAELANEAVKRNIVVSISARTAGRFLKSGRLKAASHTILSSPSASD